MRVRLSQPAYTLDLLIFLREGGCVAEHLARDEIEVSVPGASDAESERTELGIYLAEWRALNPDVGVEIVDA